MNDCTIRSWRRIFYFRRLSQQPQWKGINFDTGYRNIPTAGLPALTTTPRRSEHVNTLYFILSHNYTAVSGGGSYTLLSCGRRRTRCFIMQVRHWYRADFAASLPASALIYYVIFGECGRHMRLSWFGLARNVSNVRKSNFLVFSMAMAASNSVACEWLSIGLVMR